MVWARSPSVLPAQAQLQHRLQYDRVVTNRRSSVSGCSTVRTTCRQRGYFCMKQTEHLLAHVQVALPPALHICYLRRGLHCQAPAHWRACLGWEAPCNQGKLS